MDKKLIDLLYTARWAIKNKKNDFAYEKVTDALYHTGGLERPNYVEIEGQEKDRPNNPPVIPSIVEPKFELVKGVSFDRNGFYKTPSGMFEGLVTHYTVSGNTRSSAIGVIRWLASKGLGCMTMDKDGIIYIPENFDPLRNYDDHAGKSKWGNKTYVSKYFAGMEICSWGRGSKVGPFRESKGEANIIAGKYQAYTEKQEDSLINFCLWALTVNKEFKIENIVGHDELRAEFGLKGDKQDPGASLSMTMPEFRKLIKNKWESTQNIVA